MNKIGYPKWLVLFRRPWARFLCPHGLHLFSSITCDHSVWIYCDACGLSWGHAQPEHVSSIEPHGDVRDPGIEPYGDARSDYKRWVEAINRLSKDDPHYVGTKPAEEIWEGLRLELFDFENIRPEDFGETT